ncbi:predicted protein [Botrytis cinerea T4]|uniref:Uncharacterized protein n=1 Tax=Botryotinia fuckeliana (strain T4) TaxID=999810 RepID=G2Y5X2_BOTF4|nr:predicted protein [Botrytis cinerea T4]
MHADCHIDDYAASLEANSTLKHHVDGFTAQLAVES